MCVCVCVCMCVCICVCACVNIYAILYMQSGQNICRLFQVLAQLFFTATKTELDSYRQKVSVRVASRVAERLKTFKILRKFLKYLDLMVST